jgi:uncharacterized delta-60 repeat protein
MDRSFGSNGVVLVSLGPKSHTLAGVAIQPDGRIVVNGYLLNTPDSLGIVRMEPDGSLDPTFGDGGKVIMTEFDQFTATGLALQPDGAILSGGSYVGPFSNEFGVVRHRSDGTLDTTFGEGGIAHLVLNGLSEEPEDLAVQPNGLIVQAGSSPDDGSENDMAAVWYEPDGSVHSELNTPLFGAASFGFAVVVQPDGKAVVAGAGGSTFDETRFGLARFLPT